MRTLIIAAAVAFSMNTSATWANQIEPVDLQPIKHVEATLVVVGTDGSETSYTPADLEKFPTYQLTTTTPWREEPARFEGVLLSDLLKQHGLETVRAIEVTAENDYSTTMKQELLHNVKILVATRVNGQAHNRRARGPIQFVIDMDTYEKSDLTSESNLVWMAARIEADG